MYLRDQQAQLLLAGAAIACYQSNPFIKQEERERKIPSLITYYTSPQPERPPRLPTAEMPVTELATIPSATPGHVPVALVEVLKAAQVLQGEWCTAHAPSLPLDHGVPARRGAALYVRLDDPGVVLITAHWESTAQHAACVASELNQRAMGSFLPLVVAEGIHYFHVGGVEMFGDGDGDGKREEEPPLHAAVVSVARVMASRVKQAGFEEAFASVKGLLDKATSPWVHKSGWRIEREEGRDEDVEEFVLVGGWESEEKVREYLEGRWEGFGEYMDALRPLVLDVDLTAYRKLA
ncbi:Uu.00g058440.m01.CDS01 [Anthostomella pinea]|uniref:Uu.00g058440.m01.CDS01 n=1 Tax=Anthostomella pinea TaxID=933095 RepID=A0AAI8VSN8_9PEZI|nr:Uu.00g058440.m01.CDS01 [Anthostomella pinea]